MELFEGNALMNVVIGVLLIIFLGFFIYMLIFEKKVRDLEDKFDSDL